MLVSCGALAAAAAGACESALDCSLNGDCVDSVCACDAAWKGSEVCDVLKITAGSEKLGYHNTSGYASWGGNVVFAEGV